MKNQKTWYRQQIRAMLSKMAGTMVDGDTWQTIPHGGADDTSISTK